MSEYRVIALNPLCDECIKVMKYRRKHPDLVDPRYPNSILIYTGNASRLLKHRTHVDITWRGRGSTIVQGDRKPSEQQAAS